MAEADARFLARRPKPKKSAPERAENYDQDRAQARMVMLEEQGILDSKIRERDEILSGELFPGAPEKDKRTLLANLERDIAAKTEDVDELLAVIGDPETVADAKGWLPAERREMALVLFTSRRGLQVRELRARVADGQATLKSLKGQGVAAVREPAGKPARARRRSCHHRRPSRSPCSPPGAPIEEVIAQLTTIQAAHRPRA